MRFTKEEFIKAINTYEEMCGEEREILYNLGVDPEWTPGGWLGKYYELIEDMCDFTEEELDSASGTVLDIYCYNLDFGNDWEPGDYVVEGEDVPLRNAEDLWYAIIG